MGEKQGTLTDTIGSTKITMHYELHYDDEQFAINNDTPEQVIQGVFEDLKEQAMNEIQGIHDSQGFHFNKTIEQPMAGYTMPVQFSATPIQLRYEGGKGGPNVGSPFEKMSKLKKTSCCCGATKANPCACMKKGVMDCSSKEPKCPCYKAKDLKKSFAVGWSVVKSPCTIEKGGGPRCPTCGLDSATLSMTGCPMQVSKME